MKLEEAIERFKREEKAKGTDEAEVLKLTRATDTVEVLLCEDVIHEFAVKRQWLGVVSPFHDLFFPGDRGQNVPEFSLSGLIFDELGTSTDEAFWSARKYEQYRF